nr:hypothetical protein FAC6B23_21 [Penicillium fuscum]UXX61844.1 hypothetical protein FAC4N16_17 [Penicillium fuscum]
MVITEVPRGFVHQQWAFIMGDNSASLLDSDTVDELETLMPGISFHDKAVIEDKMEKRKIFRNIESNEQRMQVLGRIIRIRGRILSFHTFTRDFIYFEACMGALKPLQPIDSKETMFEGFTRSYLRHQSHVFDVQLAEDSFEPRDGDTHNVALCYQQLFLAVMRDFPALTSLLPYRDDRKVRPKESGFRLERDLNLAQLAIRLGFKNAAILAINEQAGSNRYQIATEEFLHQIQPRDRYNANTETTEGLANYVSEGITNNCAIRPSPQEARLTTDLEKLPKKLRCSRPSYKNYENDRQFLFLDIILQEDISRSHATSFAVQRDIFFSFFGGNYHKTQDFNEYSSADNPRVIDSQEDLFNASEESSPRVSLSTTSLQHAGVDGPAYNDSGEETEEIIYREDISAMNEASESDDPLQALEQHSPTRDSFETHSVSTGTNSIADDEEFTVLDQNTLPYAVIRNILSQTNDILLYIWQNRRYAQLSSSPEDKPFFDRVVKKLANRQQVFISTQGNRLPHLIMLKNLYNSAISERLILVGPKADSAGLSGTLISRIRQGNFLHFIDEGFDFEDTGI